MDMLWLIIAFALMAILPDLLRRRRHYPKRKGPIPVPPRRKPAPVKTPAPAETGEEAAGNEASTRERTVPVPPPIVPAAMPSRPAAASPVSVPRRVRPAAWSQLTPQARELYAGFVWSEIWQEPLASRRRLIKK